MLVAAIETVFEAEGDVTKAVGRGGRGMKEKWWWTDAHFESWKWDDLEAFGIPEVPGRLAGGRGCADEVRAEPLLDARVGGDEGTSPVRLVDLGCQRASFER